MKYVVLDIDQINRIEPLWKKLIGHLFERSALFKHEFKSKTFVDRIKPYLEKVDSGFSRIVVVMEGDEDIGYCLSSITKDLIGEVDSIYVDSGKRGCGMGEYLMKDALAFFKQHNTVKDIVSVSEGNEDVIAFYKSFGYELRSYTLVRIED